MIRLKLFFFSGACALVLAANSQAGFLVQVDTDGDSANAAFTPPPQFSLGGDTTTVSASAHSLAVGLAVGNSVFGGNGVNEPDTYVYTYDPDVDGDNLSLAAGTPLNDDGDVAGGFAAGGSGRYKVYATWPLTDNVSGGLTRYQLTDDLSNTLFDVRMDQNGGDGPGNAATGGLSGGDEWILLGDVSLDAARTYTLIQQPETNSFVSMRAEGVLFDRIPEPTSVMLLGVLVCGLLAARQR